jgi:hypothetical protein
LKASLFVSNNHNANYFEFADYFLYLMTSDSLLT